ncbi:hypothetical protein ASD64_01800 [Mesorhizobium sp. Root157]|uniref:DUF2125 domain-containing protein n=1 Tax=Mesorhizobium sp. Root157 TaxID=1736477 RepID=UPI0006F1D7A8|nr:DUF2125 domain-containing protein [Mesorhizobium sp. Root157]KRA00328.1 hypothetical protein ASD64_01800 [Mesorhizobium sp. Root157]
MTSSEQVKSKRRRGLLPWLVVLLVLLFGLYSAGWFYMADKISSEASQAVAALNARGIQADCANLRVSGYPLRLAVDCDGMAYEDDTGNVAVSAGALTAVTSLVRPLLAEATLRGPLRTIAPGMPPLWLDWDNLDVSAKLFWPLPRKVSLAADGLSGQTDPADDSDPVQLFNAATAQVDFQPDGRDLVYAGTFEDLEIAAEALDGRTVPPLNGAGAATLKNGVALLRSRPQSLRGQAVEIANLELSSGEAQVSVSGPVAVDVDGLIDADLLIKLRNPQVVAAILATAIPEQASKINQGFAALSMLGSEPSLPLKIVEGKAVLGFIPLGSIKPID